MSARIYTGAEALALVDASETHSDKLIAAAPDLAASIAHHETCAARRRAISEVIADDFDRLVARAWEAATGETHEGPASTDALLDAVRRLRAERDALKARSEVQS